MTQRIYSFLDNQSQTSGYSSFVSSSQSMDSGNFSSTPESKRERTHVESPDLYTRYLRSCKKKQQEKLISRSPEKSLEIDKLMHRVDEIYVRIDSAFKSLQTEEKDKNACVLAAVEKIFKTLEEKVQSLNEKISAQQSKIEELAQKNLSPKTKEESAQTEKIESAEIETQTEKVEENRPKMRLRTRTYSENITAGKKRPFTDPDPKRYLNHSLSIPRSVKRIRPRSGSDARKPPSVLRAMQQKRLSGKANLDSFDEITEEFDLDRSKNSYLFEDFGNFSPNQHSTPIKPKDEETDDRDDRKLDPRECRDRRIERDFAHLQQKINFQGSGQNYAHNNSQTFGKNNSNYPATPSREVSIFIDSSESD